MTTYQNLQTVECNLLILLLLLEKLYYIILRKNELRSGNYFVQVVWTQLS